MKDWIVKYWLEALFGVVCVILGALYKRLAKKVKRQFSDQKALKDGMLALIRSEIIRCHEKYMARGWIQVYALDNVNALFKSYEALGGNGTVKKLVEDMNNLPNGEKEGKLYEIVRNS